MQNEASKQPFRKPKNLLTLVNENRLAVSIGILLFALAFALRVWRLSSTPDIFGDEVLYTGMTVTLPQYGHLVAFGQPWFIHPPLYFIFQSAFFQLAGIHGVTLANVFTGRLTACLYAALGVAAVFIWIAKVSNIQIGIATAFVLMLEPYALKYSRIGILESLVMLFAIIALVFFWRANSNSGLKNYVLAGVFFGLALLTKELAVFLIVVVVVWFLLTRYVAKNKVNVKGTTVFLVTGLLMYLAYVVWALSIDASLFLTTNYNLLERALWIIRNTGYTNPNYISFTSDFISRANIYLITYILLGVAVIASVYFIVKDRSKFTLLLSSWFIGSAIFFGVIGAHNPQFFIYVTVPAAVIAGYTIAKLASGIISRNRKVMFAALLLLFVVIGYNMAVWVVVDGRNDNAISQSINWAQENIPNGEKIWCPQYTYQFLFTNYQIVKMEAYSSLNSLKGQDIHYFITSPRWTYLVDKSTLNYITSNGTRVAVFYGRSTQEVDIYYIPNPL